jgi:leucyl-tRNA synthetase
MSRLLVKCSSYMKDVYPHAEVEQKWQKEWEKRRSFAAANDDSRPRFFALEMFPYPSGHLHMGHVRNYSLGDVVARYHRMKGENVLHPIGWDAFGLPAENAAIKNKVHPEIWTKQNIATMREQLKSMGIAYDWDREFATCDPDYYRWNQWFFIQFFKKGLVYKKKASVNWCPSCQTVLANEQVGSDGRCWRCGTLVETKELEQWFFKITAYADQLVKDHEFLRGKWPDEVLTMQSHWVGRSDGADVTFKLKDSSESLTVFTTRPDTLFGATFLVLAPEHPLTKTLAEKAGKAADLQTLIKRQREQKKTRQESPDKEGFALAASAINPVNGQAVPIWTADYVLTDYGTGAIMAVPAHDQRDFDFATKYHIPIIQVISPRSGETDKTKAFEEEGVLINSGEFNGTPSTESKRLVAGWLEKRGQGKATVTFKLRDWLISRQRYWGTPIPMIQCPTCGIVPVPEDQLPVKLPKDVEFTGLGESPLKQSASFVNVDCPKCGGKAQRETDTMDTFVDSSWYYARYTDPKNNQQPFKPELAKQWLPVNQYIGGIEHANMHLIYSRFWHKAMRDLGLISPSTPEPFERLLAQGMVTLGGSAMSKSRGNVVDPNAIIEKYGADTARAFILFAAPPEKQLEWNDDAVEGLWRFLNRVWRMVVNRTASPHPNPLPKGEGDRLKRKMHWAIDKVSRDYGVQIQINTAIAAIMELVNEIYSYPTIGDTVSADAIKTVLQLLSPVAPHITEELWQMLGEKGLCSESAWPQVDPQWLIPDSLEIIVQVNGKLRSKIALAPGQSKDVLEREALNDPKIKAFLTGKSVVKIIVVPDKLVNVVVK